MTTRFQLVILDEDHIILTTHEQMSQESVRRAQEAFGQWRDSGGALIIGDCLTYDRKPVFIELDLEAASRGQSADISGAGHPAPGTQGTSQGTSQDTDTRRPRGLLSSDSDKRQDGILDRNAKEIKP